MKQLFTFKNLYFILFLIFSTLASAQNKYDVLFRNGTYLPQVSTKTPTEGIGKSSEKQFLAIQFYEIPNEFKRNELEKNGVKLIDYVPNNCYIAVLAAKNKIEWSKYNVRSIFALEAGHKLENLILDGNYPEWCYREQGFVDLTIQTFEKVESRLDVERQLSQLEARVLRFDDEFRSISIRIAPSNAKLLADFAWIQWVETSSPDVQAENLPGKRTHRSNVLDFGTRNLKGTGIRIGEWDGGPTGLHKDFENRIIIVENSMSVSDHATHVAGTVLGAGLIDPTTRGMAPKATIYSYDFNGSIPNEVISAMTNYSLHLTTNSYGYGNAFVNCTLKDPYDGNSRNQDINCYNYPSLMHVHSAGNSQAVCSGGWGTTTGKAAKNVLVVGNTTAGEAISGSSSFGPVRDGRVKPEICGVGESVYSTTPNNTYQTMSGTSMSTPGVTGTLTQLYERYRQLKSNTNPSSALLKAVACNTAKDLGNAGPDFKFGYGLINGLKAVRTLEANRFQVKTISNGVTNDTIIDVPASTGRLKVMIAWNDYPGATNANPALVNNLDLQVLDPVAGVWHPWKLNPASPTTLAFREADSLNNIEQVTITNPTAGNYTFRVVGKTVPFGPQEYSLTWEIESNYIEVIYPNGGEFFVPGASETVLWDSYGIISTHTIEYSTNNGTSYTVLFSAVPSTANSYSHTVPSVASSQVRYRVTSGIYSDASDSVLTIMGTPTGLAAAGCTQVNNILLSWNTVTNATHYDVLNLDTVNGVWNIIASNLTATNHTVTGYTPGVRYWFSVRARNNTTSVVGQRSTAVAAMPASGFPSTPGAITGTFNFCITSPTNQTYSISAVSGAASYVWSVPAGATINSGLGTTSINVSFGSIGGNISVYALNGGCASNSSVSPLSINVSPTVSAGLNQNICAGNSVTLSATSSNNGAASTLKFTEIGHFLGGAGTQSTFPSYMTPANFEDYLELTNLGNASINAGGFTIERWSSTTLNITFTIPTNTIIHSGQTLVIHWGTGANDLTNLYFRGGGAADAFGSAAAVGYIIKNGSTVVDAVGMNSYSFPVASGVVAGDWSGSISTPNIAGALLNGVDNNTSSTWVVAGSSGPYTTIGTLNLNVTNNLIVAATNNWTTVPSSGFSSAGYSVSSGVLNATTTFQATVTSAASGCTGTSNTTINVTLIPATPGSISGTSAICAGSGNTYSITAVSGATSYNWTMPSGWSGSSSSTSINTTSNSNSGNVTVSATNSCGTSGAALLAITTSTSIPATPGSITGTAAICAGSGNTYSITAVSGATSYNWTMPSGWSGSSTTTSINTTSNSNSGNIAVTASNSCGTSSAATLAITTTSVPATPGSITGTAAICAGSGNTYSITAVSGATSYNWTMPSGWSGSSTTNSITTTASATSGNVTVTASNSCGTSSAATLAITTTSVPATPGSITGTAAICAGSGNTYSITAVSGATSYNWTMPSGWSGSSTTNSITTTASATSGNVTVTASNSCGTSSSATLAITTTSVPATPGSITGTAAICAGSGNTYSITAVSGATSYNWTMPSGWSGSSTTNSITTTASATSGNVTVTASNSCGTSSSATLAITTTSVPATPGSITGTAAICAGSGNTYSITAVSGATSYNWTMPSGWSGSSTTNSITTTASATSGNVTVTASNSCGTSSAATLAITTTSVPSTPSVISGLSSVPIGSTQNYSVVLDPETDSYNWSLPVGWTGNSTSNSITVVVGNNSGTISVEAENTCGISSIQSKSVTTFGLVIPTTTIRAKDCGRADFSFYTLRQLNSYALLTSVPIATSFDIEFSLDNSFTSIVATSNQKFRTIVFSKIGGLNWGSTYFVRARANVDLLNGPWGSTCTIGFVPSPLIFGVLPAQLDSHSCGRQNVSVGNSLLVTEILGTNRYIFKFYIDSTLSHLYASIVYRGRNLPVYKIFPMLNPCQTYFVTVQAQIGTVVGPIGAVCPIYMECPPPKELDNVTLNVFPNPSNGLFTFKSEGALQEILNLTLYDALGKVVMVKNITSNSSYDFGNHIATGLYILEVKTESGYRNSYKLIKTDF